MQVVAGLRPERPIGARVLGLSDNFWKLITRAWSHDSSQRPKLPEIVNFVAGLP